MHVQNKISWERSRWRMSWSKRWTFQVWKQECKAGWSCALWSAHLFPHAESCMGLTGRFILFKPASSSKCWIHQLNPPLGTGILGSVSAWIWHLLHPGFLFVQLSVVLRLENESTTRRAVAFHPAIAQLWETMAPAVLAMTLCLHTWSSEPAVIPGFAVVGVFPLRRKEISLCSSAAGIIVKKDKYSAASLPVSCLSLKKKKNHPLITEVEWD